MKMLTGVQQIMIGRCCKDYESALTTLKKIKVAGYDSIELNDFMIHPTPFFVRMLTKAAGMPTGNCGKLDWHKLIADSGLKVASLHSYLNSIEENPKVIAEEALSFGTDTIVITGMYRFDYSKQAEVEQLASRLNEAGKALSKYGVKLLYHNHNVELQKVNENQTAFDILIEQTDERYVSFEVDTYWLADGGADVISIMRKLGKRMTMWHINDRGCRNNGPYTTPILKMNAMELGTGNMELSTMLEIAKENEVKAIVLETHKNWIDNNPIKSVEVSSKWLRNNM